LARTLTVSGASWSTPATSFPLRSYGRARITRTYYGKGAYHMDGIGGYDYYEVKDSIPITSLRLGGVEWMVDDPPHWLGLQLIARECRGRVLCVGLGLGLIVFALRGNSAVSEVAVLEKEEEIIRLIAPLLPPCKVLRGDFWRFARFHEYDTIFVDIWSGYETRPKVLEMKRALALLRERAPHAAAYLWGLRDPLFNPAYRPAP
jgi:hypothetical protein